MRGSTGKGEREREKEWERESEAGQGREEEGRERLNGRLQLSLFSLTQLHHQQIREDKTVTLQDQEISC